MGRKSELSASQRQDVVLMMLRKEEPISLLARRYGVSETTLHRWREGFLTAGQAALACGRRKQADAEAERVRQLERDVADSVQDGVPRLSSYVRHCHRWAQRPSEWADLVRHGRGRVGTRRRQLATSVNRIAESAGRSGRHTGRVGPPSSSTLKPIRSPRSWIGLA